MCWGPLARSWQFCLGCQIGFMQTTKWTVQPFKERRVVVASFYRGNSDRDDKSSWKKFAPRLFFMRAIPKENFRGHAVGFLQVCYHFLIVTQVWVDWQKELWNGRKHSTLSGELHVGQMVFNQPLLQSRMQLHGTKNIGSWWSFWCGAVQVGSLTYLNGIKPYQNHV